MYTRSDLDGFRVDALGPEEDQQGPGELDTDSESEFVRYEVPTTDGGPSVAVESAEIEPERISQPVRAIAERAATTAGFTGINHFRDHCGWAIGGCVSSFAGSISGCMRCAPACLGSPTGVGLAICFLCVFGVCGHLISGLSCANAARCIENY